ncbi:diaminobutyrate acetyltransferase [Marinagarivorans cellulosilyticus]|uniref:L-2,4-diaminobutyric acid acetyltransferase n=1 Tax=Marinagarivorans cellulosilyticus TaxID=2721545 RepID=A0AAN1WG56_9GAMM|nr:diaminobutyrate acetyltransferase [Marinagarivorans cellulosilyticus]BCD96997.1 L-2,4-diaminobutyric acid acetyltransferase [Marinagarivorans cellulosilyticus]
MHTETVLRKPEKTDGMRVHALVQQCPPLDPNSSYCNLLQCTHFSDTCVAAERDNELVGFISGYRPPSKSNTLFIWQVAVSESARGCGLASKMLQEILARENCRDVQFIETTITADNAGSWALFTKLSKHLDTQLERSTYFDKHEHFHNRHDSELLARIGPFNTATL